MGSKLLIKMTRLQNIKMKRKLFYSPDIFIKNYDTINIRRPCAPELTLLCSEVIMAKTFILIKAGGPGSTFGFVSFIKAFFY